MQDSVQYVQVAIPVPMRQLFSYQVPAPLQLPEIIPGERIIAPFGNRQVVGIVLSVDKESDISAEKIKPISSRVSDNFHFDQALLNFLQLCANYYHHPIGDVLQLALPVLLRQLKQPDTRPAKTWACTEILSVTAIEELKKKAPKQHQLYLVFQSHKNISWPELRTLGFSKTQLNALNEKSLIEEREQELTTFHWLDSMLNREDKLQLSIEQALIVSAVQQNQDKFGCHLIDGITGSGKTEVYLQAIEEVLATDKQVLILVPEIGLTPQTLNRFEQRFDVPIYLHHSGLNDKERLETWLAAQQGKAAIVVGTRSAIFTPLKKLGLIIVDEEHDNSFKQQDSFRYHGRDIAILRARQLNIPILLGSATPSLESLQNALSGKYHYHQLLKRAGTSTQAKISLVDLTRQPTEFGLSHTVKHEIKATLAKGEQALVFLNRRGYAPAINCQECHWIADCQRCNKPYTLHQGQGLLICHHCGSQKRLPRQCPSCGSVRITSMGLGTEQLEQKINEEFSDYSAVRIDRDSTRRKGELTKLLQEVAEKKHQLLIGTQMLAKGHHFPDVTLVAILDIDGALFSFDFRAAEQMAQLLVQVAGRSGRASKPGQVLVQTHYPDHPLLQDLVNNGYSHFAQFALQERKQALLPPFSYQALIRAEANYPSYPDKFLRELCQYPLEGCEFAGPVPAAMEKKAGKYRYHLIVQAKERKALHQGVQHLIQQGQSSEWHNKLRWSVDIDPMDLSW